MKKYNKDMDMPKGLTPMGIKAHEIIMGILTKDGATYTGGCKAFYSPEEWEDRGEEYGQDGELVVVYDGGDHARYFSLDRDYPHYKNQDKMRLALEAEGLYFEEGTTWYGAVRRR